MKIIKLTQNKISLIDNEDFEKINQFKWYFTSRGYAATKSNKGSFLMHRLIMNAPKGKVIDHINLNQLDNRKKNLRICTQQQNTFNSKLPKNNTSGYKGVAWKKDKHKYVAQIMIQRKSIYLGLFKDINEAIKVRQEAEKLYFGSFAYRGGI